MNPIKVNQSPKSGAVASTARGSWKLISLLCNFLLPGVGSLFIGKVVQGVAQFFIWSMGLLLLPFFGIGIPLMAIGWIWAIVSSASTPVRHVVTFENASDARD